MSQTDRLSRRRLMSAAAFFALAAAPRVASAQATPVASPAADASAFPVTIAHAFGETTISSLPERIVLTDENAALDSLLALGVRPAGMMIGGGYIGELAPWAIAAGADTIPVIPGTPDGEIDFEAIAAVRPDLILTSLMAMQDIYDTLSTIAPTIVYKASDSETRCRISSAPPGRRQGAGRRRRPSSPKRKPSSRRSSPGWSPIAT